MKAVILAGSPGTARFPFGNYFPKLGLPVANEPLLHHLAHHLETAGITEIVVSVYRHHAVFRALAQKINRHPDLSVEMKIVKDVFPCGTAGCLKKLKEFAQDSDVLLLSSSAFISGQDLRRIVRDHEGHDAGLTVVTASCVPNSENLENFKIDEKGFINEFVVLHRSQNRRNHSRCSSLMRRDRRRCYCSAGIYVMSPRVLSFIPDDGGYMDIHEQLIPALNAAGVPVRSYIVDGPPPKITGLEQYYQANRQTLTTPGEDQDFVFRNSYEISQGVWVGDGVKIDPSALIVGPVLIGDDCVVGKNAEITGPASLGAGSCVQAGASVSESFLGALSRVGRKASVENSLVAKRAVVKKGEIISRSVVVNAKDLKGGLWLLPVTRDDGFQVLIRHGAFAPRVQAARRAYSTAKRVFDIVAAASLLALLSPVFLVVAIVTKREGDGPVFYSQRRCGKDGKEFRMYKFRTMVVDAHALQEKYAAKKDVDGPMFKLEGDPRVTRIGRFLRDSSLDELPQLVNVLRSEMSLVGPRPLVMKEMDFAPSWRDIRLSVKPGITGLWQVNGRHKVSFHDWIKHDIRYVRERCLKMDLSILLHTVKVLRGGANL